MKRKLMPEIQNLLGGKTFGRKELSVIAAHLKKPAYNACSFETILMESGDRDKKAAEFRKALQIARADVGTKSTVDYAVLIRMILGCYFIDNTLASEKEMERFLLAIRAFYFFCLSEEDLYNYVEDLVHEALLAEGRVVITEDNEDKTFAELVSTIDLIYVRNYLCETLNLPFDFSVNEDDTVSSVVDSICGDIFNI
ncbi:MAG: hypothetical protein LBR70_00865 [Lactobacillaceae bacterium]|nr:hypothetical protein [Lactobacillaceae bacterium]